MQPGKKLKSEKPSLVPKTIIQYICSVTYIYLVTL